MRMSDEMRAALEQLVRQAMASGAGYFAENLSKFDSRILSDCFDDFPAQFVQIRGDLVEDVLVAAGVDR